MLLACRERPVVVSTQVRTCTLTDWQSLTRQINSHAFCHCIHAQGPQLGESLTGMDSGLNVGGFYQNASIWHFPPHSMLAPVALALVKVSVSCFPVCVCVVVGGLRR